MSVFAPEFASLGALQWVGAGWFVCFTCATLLCAYLFSYGRHKRYEGNPIYVRLPKNGGWETMDFSTARVNSVFTGHFVLLISALIVPLELSATSFCNDEDGSGVQGFLNQEMNHGTGHTVLNRIAEEKGVAPTYLLQKFFTFVFMRLFPAKLSYAFLGVLESGFIVWVHFLSQSRWVFERFAPSPYFMVAYHLQEEAEHHWSSMFDIMQLPFGYRLLAFLLSVPLLTVMALVYPIVAGLLYSPRRLFLEGAIFRDTLEFVAWMPFFLFTTHACNFLHVICNLTPSSAAYKAQLQEGVIPGRKTWRNIYGPYEDMFRVAEVQCSMVGNVVLVPAKGFRPSLHSSYTSYTSSGCSPSKDVGTSSSGDADLAMMRVLVKRWLNFSSAHEQLTQVGVPEADLEHIFSKKPTEDAMLRASKGAASSLSVSIAEAAEAGLQRFTLAEVLDKGYLVVDGNVVDVSSYTDHPGGQLPFKKFAGRDVSMQFAAIHTGTAAFAKMEKLRVGVLAALDVSEGIFLVDT